MAQQNGSTTYYQHYKHMALQNCGTTGSAQYTYHWCTMALMDYENMVAGHMF
jgi:hypothetical protein